MVDRWPSCARVSATDSTGTIILPVAAATCRAHGDAAPVTITFTEGAPGASGNGHPAEGIESVTHWGRCGTCDRLFLVIVGSAFKRFSHRLDLTAEQVLKDTYLDEANPNTNRESLTACAWSGTAGTREHPLIRIAPIAPLLTRKARVIKAELQVNISALSGATSCPLYRCLRAAEFPEMTWNDWKSGSAWSGPGCLGEDEDYDPTLLSNQSPLATGWFPMMAGTEFTAAVDARREEAWIACALNTGSGRVEFASAEAGSNKPYLRVWYEDR